MGPYESSFHLCEETYLRGHIIFSSTSFLISWVTWLSDSGDWDLWHQSRDETCDGFVVHLPIGILAVLILTVIHQMSESESGSIVATECLFLCYKYLQLSLQVKSAKKVVRIYFDNQVISLPIQLLYKAAEWKSLPLMSAALAEGRRPALPGISDQSFKADLDGTTLTLTVTCNLLKSWLVRDCRRVLKHVSKSYNFFQVVCDSLGEVVRLIYTKQSMSYGWCEQVACDSHKSKLCLLNRPLGALSCFSATFRVWRTHDQLVLWCFQRRKNPEVSFRFSFHFSFW